MEGLGHMGGEHGWQAVEGGPTQPREGPTQPRDTAAPSFPRHRGELRWQFCDRPLPSLPPPPCSHAILALTGLDVYMVNIDLDEYLVTTTPELQVCVCGGGIDDGKGRAG